MSKAEEFAIKKYPVSIEDIHGHKVDVNLWQRKACAEGYRQAEKDNELTIEDIEKIHTFLYAIKHNKQGVFTFTRLSDEQYQEVLKRFKGLKERKEKRESLQLK